MPVAAPIMHPLFANADPNQVPPQNTMMNPGMPDYMNMNQNQGMYGQPPSMNTSTQYYPQQQQQQQHQQTYDPNVINNNQINYSNFSNIQGAQQAEQMTYPIAEPVQPAKEVPRAKPPLPEEFIHFQTVFEELKSHCINKANNPVNLNNFVNVLI